MTGSRMQARMTHMLLGLMFLGLWSCNEHPVQPLDRVVTAVNRQANQLPAKTKIDFLFVIDTSSSMCEEQENLSRNFTTFANFLFNELGASADYRIATTNMDLQDQDSRGRFLMDPAPDGPAVRCDQDGSPIVFETAQCADLGLSEVIRADQIQSEQQLVEYFGCMATLGADGHGIERGLESMRMALSCNGPNAERFFGGCCIVDPSIREGDPSYGRKIYNPACAPEIEGFPEPEFLRPDALLVVIFVSDEDDCSAPEDNRAETRRPICKYAITDQDGDGVPDGYNDAKLCGRLSPAACYLRDCGELSPQDCLSRRCQVEGLELRQSACVHNRDALTDVNDYARFLEQLKANPLEQLVVATIVGQRFYTESGKELSYVRGNPDAAICEPDIVGGATTNLDDIRTDMCCPNGVCKGIKQISCESQGNGIAYAGTRYLKLSEAFGGNGIGCPELTLDTVSPEQITPCQGQALDAPCALVNEGGQMAEGKCRPIVDNGQLACGECLSICEDSFEKPLLAIKEKVAKILATYCLDKKPACVVVGDGERRFCETDEERADTQNYLHTIQVRSQCLLTEAQDPENGRCEEVIPPRLLAENEWILELGHEECAGQSLIRLVDPPPAGSEIFVEFFVDVAPPEARGDAEASPDSEMMTPSEDGMPASMDPAPEASE